MMGTMILMRHGVKAGDIGRTVKKRELEPLSVPAEEPLTAPAEEPAPVLVPEPQPA